MSIRYTETKSDTDSRMEIDLGDGRHLTINISHEGIVMDVYNYIDGWEDSPDMGLVGTVAMTFDEWAEDIVANDPRTIVLEAGV